MEPDSHPEIFREKLLADLSGDELLRRWKLGDERAASVLVDRYTLRLVALVASRLNRRFQDTIDPEDVVQSAMGSFFAAARQSRLRISQSVSLWHLLAAFAKRKMLRTIERQSAAKRGGEFQRVGLDERVHAWEADPSEARSEAVEELLRAMDEELPSQLREVLDHLLAGRTRKEIAEALNLTERTVRRRVVRLRDILASEPQRSEADADGETVSPSLPRIDYHEFVLGKLVGAGGFGKVYRSTMQTDGSVVAVKFLRKAFWWNDEAKRSFLREVDQASQIDLPSVVRYLGWGESPHGGPYVVARWIDGVTLAERHDVSPERFMQYLLQICDTVGAVHAAGVIHGDLTPSNILVTAPDRIVITDFGFSQHVRRRGDRPAGPQETVSPLGGTLGFAAPEQISPSFGRIGPGTDIYAVGGLAYWYLAGNAPHDRGASEASLASTIASADTDTSQLPSDSPATSDIKRVAAATLRKSVNDRPQTIAEVADLLTSPGSAK